MSKKINYQKLQYVSQKCEIGKKCVIGKNLEIRVEVIVFQLSIQYYGKGPLFDKMTTLQ